MTLAAEPPAALTICTLPVTVAVACASLESTTPSSGLSVTWTLSLRI